MRRVAVLAALVVVLGGASAQAEAIGPERAAEMLAHAWMVDNRCNILGKDDRDALTGFVARAELSLAQLRSVDAARKAIREGRASGTSAACDAASAQFVQDTLRVAKSATAGLTPVLPEPPKASSSTAPVAPLKTEERIAKAETVVAVDDEAAEPPKAAAPPPVKKKADVAKPIRKTPPAKVAKAPAPKKPAPGALAGYAVTAETYYRELRCRNRSFPAVNALYAKVLRQHRQAVAAGGKAAVRALLKAAEARAARGAC